MDIWRKVSDKSGSFAHNKTYTGIHNIQDDNVLKTWAKNICDELVEI